MPVDIIVWSKLRTKTRTMQRSVRSRRIFFLSLPFYAVGRTDASDPELGLLRPDPGCRRPLLLLLLRLAVSSSSRNGRRYSRILVWHRCEGMPWLRFISPLFLFFGLLLPYFSRWSVGCRRIWTGMMSTWAATVGRFFSLSTLPPSGICRCQAFLMNITLQLVSLDNTECMHDRKMLMVVSFLPWVLN